MASDMRDMTIYVDRCSLPPERREYYWRESAREGGRRRFLSYAAAQRFIGRGAQTVNIRTV